MIDTIQPDIREWVMENFKTSEETEKGGHVPNFIFHSNIGDVIEYKKYNNKF